MYTAETDPVRSQVVALARGTSQNLQIGTGMESIDLFCGIGGASFGMQAAGITPVLGVDSDHTAALWYGMNGFNPVNCRVQDLTHLPHVDVWFASPPCQPFSTGGDRKFEADERDAFPELLDLLNRKYIPSWLVIENVPGLDGSAYIARILAKLATCFRFISTRVLDAQWLGVPQTRKRLFIVCSNVTQIVWPEESTRRVSVAAALKLPDDTTGYTASSGLGGASKPRCISLPARTITTRGNFVISTNGYRRSLDPKSLATLQGFPDRVKLPKAKMDGYRLVGNAVPPPVVSAIMQNIRSLHEET